MAERFETVSRMRTFMIPDRESEESEELDFAVDSDKPTRHGEEYQCLEYLGEVDHVASGGSASYMWLDSPTLAKFRSPMENTALHLAALHGNDAMVDRVATQHPNLQSSRNANGDTPLHVAARAGHISTLTKLLDACASSRVTGLLELMEMRNKQGNIMLHEAIMSGGTMASRIFHVLEACSAAVEPSGRLMETRDAIKPLSESCYELALNNVNNRGQSVLYLAVEAGLMEAVIRILENCPESAPPKGRSPLVAAIMKRDKGMMDIIMTKKQQWMHLRDKNGRLPLHRAASIGDREVVVSLLGYCRPCSHEKDRSGALPVHLATRGGHVEVIKEFLLYCPDPTEMVDQDLRNILHTAAEYGKLDVVRYIFQNPDLEKMINQKDVLGKTPLHVATFFHHPKIVYALTWDHRVDINAVNQMLETPLDIALENYSSLLRQSLTCVALKSAGAKRGPRHSFQTAPNLDISNRYKDRADSLSVTSALVVTASVAACFAVPGEAEGTANNLHKAMFHLFTFCITISLFSSISATIMLIWGRLEVIELLIFAIKLAMPLIGAALITLSLAFLAGVYTVISKLTWLATTFVVITAIFVAILCLQYIFLVLPSSSTGKFLRYISHYPFIILASVTEEGKPQLQPQHGRRSLD